MNRITKSMVSLAAAAALMFGGAVSASATDSTYKAARAEYRQAMVEYRAARTDMVAFRTAMNAFNATKLAWVKQRMVIGDAFRAAVSTAQQTFVTAKQAAKTDAERLAAKNAHTEAIAAAVAARDAAVKALGAMPVKPADLVKPAKPVKPVKPVKPTPAATPAA